jgi:hypothetical protein
MRKLAMFVYGQRIVGSTPTFLAVTFLGCFCKNIPTIKFSIAYQFFYIMFLSNFDLTIYTVSSLYLLVATEYIVVSPDFFSAVAFISFISYAYVSTNKTVDNFLTDIHTTSLKEIDSVMSLRTSRTEEQVTVLEVEKEALLALSAISNTLPSIKTPSVSFLEPALADSVYVSSSLSHTAVLTRNVNSFYSSLLNASMFGQGGYYTLLKDSFLSSSSTLHTHSKRILKTTPGILFTRKRAKSSSESRILKVSALRRSSHARKFAIVGAASSIRKKSKSASMSFKKESLISKITTKLSSKPPVSAPQKKQGGKRRD